MESGFTSSVHFSRRDTHFPRQCHLASANATMTSLLVLIMISCVVVMASDDIRSSIVKSNGIVWLDTELRTSYRHRRDVDQTQKSQLVSIHNELRRKERASNMELLTWNDYLANMAADWAGGCNFQHGQPPRDVSTAPYNPVGQNLYAISGGDLNVTRAVIEWYNEKIDFDFDTLGCTEGKMCGHYTQVVWSSSRQVGCAYQFCNSLGSTTLVSANYLVCNYGPAGNFRGEKPYKKGNACSQCLSGIGWCTDGLCNSNCKKSDSSCRCGAVCYNCGKLQLDSCICQCADGWYGNDCSVVCNDKNKNCNANPGWPPNWCNHPENGDYVRDGCPAMCGLCKQVQDVKPGQCAPVGGISGEANTANHLESFSLHFAVTIVLLTLINGCRHFLF